MMADQRPREEIDRLQPFASHVAVTHSTIYITEHYSTMRAQTRMHHVLLISVSQQGTSL